MNLNVGSWKEFRLGELFSEMYKAKAHVKSELDCYDVPSDNTIRFISRTEMNNGCDCYVLNNDLSGIEKGNAISIGDTTATCFYQGEDFVCGDHMVICRADWINLHTALFIISVLKQEKYKYSYGRAFKMELISNTILKLPSTADNTPDWDFMEHYIKSLNYKPISTTVKPQQVVQLNISEWKEYTLGQLFIIKKGKRLTKANMIEGCDNYLGAIDNNNGVRQKISADKLWEPNCITVNYNGSVGEAFYQSEPFWASDDVNVLYPNGWKLNKYVGLFIATVIKAERPKYNYGRKWTKDIMNRSVINLPSKEGRPDFDFMEKYIKTLPYSDRI